MNRIFKPGDLVLVELPGHLGYAARVETSAHADDRHHVTPLSTVDNERPSKRFFPWWRLYHALWTFTGFVAKP